MSNELKEHLRASYEKIQHDPNVRLAMRARCSEQGHEWENNCSIGLRVFAACKWCGEEK